jgi:diguanylate cyclase (GGDEF)-like protein/PAS domain S-box-containing protein
MTMAGDRSDRVMRLDETRRAGDGRPTHWGRQEFARAWAKVLDGTSYVTMSPAEVEALTSQLADLVADALFDEPFTAAAGEQIGRALVGAHFTGTQALRRTIAVLGDLLLPCLGRRLDDWLRPRLSDLQGAVASGYATALLGQALAEQEEIRAAALTARDRAQAAWRESEARFRALFAEAAVGIGIGDTAGQILEVNQALMDLLGYNLAEFRSRNVADFMHPEDAAVIWADYRDLVEGRRDAFRTEKRFYRKDGTAVWTHLTVSLIRGDDGSPRYQVAVIVDITDRHVLQERLAYEATHDPLTGLPNRALFLDVLTSALATPHPGDRVGVCFLDLDGFKVINDSLGHSVGDQLLAAVAERLSRQATAEGGLIARLGGDEFVVLVARSSGESHLTAIAERMLDALAEPVPIAGHQLRVGASVGIVEHLARQTTATDLMRAADITLHSAKTTGKGRAVYADPSHNADRVTRYTLAATLPGALDRGEFDLVYQPLVRLRDERLHGVEALLRWRHPRFGVLKPDQFVELAEETGAIIPLGRWVLGEACRQTARWHRLMPADALISVNIAVRQLQEPGVVEEVRRILAETGVPARRLQLEITESAIMSPAAHGPLAALQALAEMGVRIAVDDFGTGYSNLAYLRQLPLHELKLAGPFLAGLRSPDHPDPVDAEVVTALVALAHTLGLTVTAEGVETRAQAERLRDMGCDTAQGWYYARPAPPDTLATSWAVASGVRLPAAGR